MIRSLIFYLPFLVPALITALFSAYVSFLDNTECAFLLGINVSLLGLLVFCFLLPGIVAIASLYGLFFSIKTRGQDFYPPTDIPWASVFKKRSGRRARVPKLLGYLLPIVSVWLVWLGISSFIEIADGRTLSEMSAAIGAGCKHS
ncbi:hypothetical protein [Arsukibacterium sp.]|uniref:hypothetical protein n=1 Tax=Arsukibacterium sp. TaxID=1977258 RepID=UPI002FDB769D